MIAWLKNLFRRKPVAPTPYQSALADYRAAKAAAYTTTAEARIAAATVAAMEVERRQAQMEHASLMRAAGYVQETRRTAEGRVDRVWVKPRPVRVSPQLAAAYGREQPPVRRTDEPSPTVDLMLVHSLLSSPPAPPAVEPEVCRAPSFSSGGGGDYGGGGASGSWGSSSSSSSDSSSSSSDSGSSSSSSD